MSIIRIITSIALILYGLTTFVGFWLVLSPEERAIGFVPLSLTFLFAGCGVVGGILAILNKRIASVFLVLSCLIYAAVALYQPIQYLGFQAFGVLHQDTYIGFSVRTVLASILIYILYAHRQQRGLSA